MLYETGARVKELSHVKVRDVDIEERIIWLYDSKTEPRPAIFGPETQDMLSQLRESKTFWEGTLFPSKLRIRQVVVEMLEDLGLKQSKDGRGPHTFRHFVASHLFYNGIPAVGYFCSAQVRFSLFPVARRQCNGETEV